MANPKPGIGNSKTSLATAAAGDGLIQLGETNGLGLCGNPRGEEPRRTA